MLTPTRRGPKSKPELEKKIAVKIWVKKKHEKEAQRLVNEVASIFYSRDNARG